MRPSVTKISAHVACRPRSRYSVQARHTTCFCLLIFRRRCQGTALLSRTVFKRERVETSRQMTFGFQKSEERQCSFTAAAL